MKDWTGNSKSAFVTLGASNHSDGERQQHDFYATSPDAVRQLLALEKFSPRILEPCCGAGHIAKVLVEHGYEVEARDLYSYGYGESGKDFLADNEPFDGDVITNPPYSLATKFVLHALKLIPPPPQSCDVSAAPVPRRLGAVSEPLFARLPGARVCLVEKVALRNKRRFRKQEGQRNLLRLVYLAQGIQGRADDSLVQHTKDICTTGTSAMKLTIWIRPDKDGNMTLRTDYKNESADTPNIHRYGHRLLNAIEGGGEPEK